ncbi:hypothetical protein [Vulcanisaeta thermophila]|uniref:hypothetical protein n=1 Tax=Vulcanisaeta thermophila TaxID=867917 RepID=UPI000852B763|nr:hypothetical protein [Vulcanisaeta thermophila]
MRRVAKNCLTLVINVCNDNLDKLKNLMNTAIRKVGFGGLVRVLVLKCRDLDFNRYIREVNEVVANNYTVTILVYDFMDMDQLIKELSNKLTGCNTEGILSTMELPQGFNYEKVS